MLWPLSWEDDNWRGMIHTLEMNNHALTVLCHDDNCRSMFHTLEMNNHALTIVMRRWQLSENVLYLRDE